MKPSDQHLGGPVWEEFHGETCPFCGLKYDDFKTGLTYDDVYSMMWIDDEDYSRWRYKRRHSVLGFWHEYKRSLWAEHLHFCELENESKKKAPKSKKSESKKPYPDAERDPNFVYDDEGDILFGVWEDRGFGLAGILAQPGEAKALAVLSQYPGIRDMGSTWTPMGFFNMYGWGSAMPAIKKHSLFFSPRRFDRNIDLVYVIKERNS